MEFVVAIALVIFSIILHEIAHGYTADLLGDPTARYAGRLTLNPIPHIDPVGSLLLPGLLAFSGSPFLIGWAKPVPYNPYNLRGGTWGEAAVAAAGPLTNIAIAVVAGLALRFGIGGMPDAAVALLVSLIFTNLSLAILNLIPIPPIDGSKILRALLPGAAGDFFLGFERLTYALGPFGLIFALILIVNFFQAPMGAIVRALFSFITGLR
ncbi:MAG: site-2 protease family protein, partial [Patescibacteria group bacterium]